MTTQPEKKIFESVSEIPDVDRCQGKIGFLCYGLYCGLTFDDSNLLDKLVSLLPPYHKIVNFEKAGKIFRLITKADRETNGLYWNNERIQPIKELSETIFESIQSKIQITLSVALPPKMYFLHAGAVAFNDLGIIIPGSSFSGKTTLTEEFLKFGAEYYSDDCAVIDKYGNLYPYSKTLSIRNRLQEGEIVKAEDVGAVIGCRPLPVRLVVLTEYKKKIVWKSRQISPGQTVLELSKNLFYPASMTLYPQETFQALANIVKQSKILCGTRGEASEVVKMVLKDFKELSEDTESYK